MSISQPDSRPRKLCFVTIGATAAFDALIKAALSPQSLEALKISGYTDLRLQHGRNGRVILEEFYKSSGIKSEDEDGITISAFDFNKQGLGSEMRAAKGEDSKTEGVVISHAGIFGHQNPYSWHQAHPLGRFRLDPRCSSNRCPAYRGSQYSAPRQPSSGAGGRAGKARLRDPWENEVSSQDRRLRINN